MGLRLTGLRLTTPCSASALEQPPTRTEGRGRVSSRSVFSRRLAACCPPLAVRLLGAAYD